MGWQWKWERFQDGQPRYGGSPAASHSQTRVVWTSLLRQPYSCPPDSLASFGKGRNEDEEAFEKSVLEARERSTVSVTHPPSYFEPASALGSI